MSLTRLLFACALAFGLAACASGPQVHSDYDHQANFAAYRSFGFEDKLGTDVAGYSTLVTQRLKSAVTREMTARGYTFDATAPDLLVNFHARMRDRTRVDRIPDPMMGGYYGYRMGMYGPWPGWGYDTFVDQYTEGTLNIDVIDREKRQMVWEGVAVGRVDSAAQADQQAAIDATVADIFARYPFVAGRAQPVTPAKPAR